MATILDVLDNYLSASGASVVDRLSGRALWRLGEEVQRFAASYEPPRAEAGNFPIYIGGWPSANFFFADQGELVLSSLLYCGQVIAKDPISDWFSPDRYLNDHVMAGRPGFLNSQGEPNVVGTRGFLANVIPALQALRPLIESGALILVPSETFVARNREAVDQVRDLLYERLAPKVDEITGRFHPADLAVDDRVRGMFVFAGGEREAQLRRAIKSSLLHFSREWLLTRGYGAEYAAPWAYEQYLCERGLDTLLSESEHQRVANALLHSELPIFQGLTPRIVTDVRNDDTFSEFRAKLFEVYRSVPGFQADDSYVRHLAQTEEAVLRPVLDRAEQEAKRGFLSRLGVGLASGAISIGARLLFDSYTGQLGWSSAARETIGVIADRVRLGGTRDPLSVWTKLYRHQRSVSSELRRATAQPGSVPASPPWMIDDQPSMNIRVSPGLLLFDEVAEFDVSPPTGYQSGPYRACGCGSGLKWKFCCQGVTAQTLMSFQPGAWPRSRRVS